MPCTAALEVNDRVHGEHRLRVFAVYPAVNCEPAVLQFLAARAAIQGVHQRAVIHVLPSA